MAYPFSAELALKISAKYAEFCVETAARMGVPKLLHPPAQPLKVGTISEHFAFSCGVGVWVVVALGEYTFPHQSLNEVYNRVQAN